MTEEQIRTLRKIGCEVDQEAYDKIDEEYTSLLILRERTAEQSERIRKLANQIMSHSDW